MNSSSAAVHYHQHRERQERAAAERARSDVSRRIHLELAERYAALAQG